MRNEVDFAWRKEYWDIYGSSCVVKDTKVNNSMETIQEFDLNYLNAT